MKHFSPTPRALAGAAMGLASLAATTSCSAQAAPPDPRPNVLLILADDVGWSDLGCMGGEIKTPNLDSLAAGGLTFTQFYNSARCSPTRASIMTGLAPHQAGFPNLSGVLSPRSVTLPEVLGAAGYSTSMVGKWHLSERSTPVDRGFSEFYGMLGGFNSYWQEDPHYTRLPKGHAKREYKPGEFYSTDAFADYSIDFLKQAQREPNKPWFQYLSFNAPHFPLHAPEEAIAPYEKVYAKGWDKIREERLEKQKALGLVPKYLQLTPRGFVPKNWINERTGWADKQNPAWDSLPQNRQADLARRMAAYAATIDLMDKAIGRVIAHLKATNQYENTLIFFLSDNGACAEWDPFGFDKLDSPTNILHEGADLKKIGTPESYVSYGSGWANASNTPWRLYKHYAQEGGIRTPLLVHWPRGLKTKAGSRTEQPGAVTDFMPTLLELCGGAYPEERGGQPLLPHQGTSLLPVFNGGALPPRTICMEHEGNRMVRQGEWKLVALEGKPWELYDLAKDPTEMDDLAAKDTPRVQKMAADWDSWAEASMVRPKPSPNLVGKALTVRCDVVPTARNGLQVLEGVLLAQGGDQRGYALHLRGGKPVFSVRQNGVLYTAASPTPLRGRASIEARLAQDGAMTLAVDGATVARAKAPGVFTAQPKDGLSIGEDAQSAVGDYEAPNAFAGKVEDVVVTPE